MDLSKLAVVPLSNNYTFVDHSMWALVYQDKNGQLQAELNDGHAARAVTMEERWETDNRTENQEYAFSSVHRASFTAFSVVRDSSESNNDINVFILYQDDLNDIKQAWTKGKSWGPSTPESLKNAEKDTDIAIAQPIWNHMYSLLIDETLETDDHLLLTAGKRTRCYFRKDDHVVEVQLKPTGNC
ncbi:hypothetical protein HJFPF1_10446 [Paramyrothecium foliicola]|nr:hypothetical protein HJFPF1_10446 [Paramyrothecium foliicola]